MVHTSRVDVLARDDFPSLLRDWRTHCKLSQLQLAADSGVSTRHISFLETGRSRPSREMVATLARSLNLSMRDSNRLLHGAGFRAEHSEHVIDSVALAPIRAAVDLLLRQWQPRPAVVLDRYSNIVAANHQMAEALQALVGIRIVSWARESSLNLIEALLDPGLLRPYIVNWPEVAAYVVARVQRDARYARDPRMDALVASITRHPGVTEMVAVNDVTPIGLVIPLVLSYKGSELRFFSTITTIGTPLDVTLSELRIETFHPMDGANASGTSPDELL